jgi:fructan beta-fructosidase
MKMNQKIVFHVFVIAFFFSVYSNGQTLNYSIRSNEKIVADSLKIYSEPFRPQFHFSPEKQWMNDPNGLVYYKGIYHLFYQYYPEDIVWGPMHWGHSTSTDLVYWKHKKTALFPDKLGYIFSGSAVVDFNNTSGLGTVKNPAMIAIFTYHNMQIEEAGGINAQSQGLAYSLDEGETWSKYKENPIITNPDLKDFRDPNVFWNKDTNTWNLILVAGDCAQFYTSENLINWKLESEFGKGIGVHGGVWECPNLFKIKVENSNEEKWVLLISINPGAPNGGSGTQYFVGDFDGKNFKTDQKETKWVDNGTDNYAGITYNDALDKKRIFIGWMSNWLYARNTPTKTWRSAMTLPRELSLSKMNQDYFLKNKPVRQLKTQFKLAFSKNLLVLKPKQKATFDFNNLNQSQLLFNADAKDLKLVFSNAVKDSLVLNYDAKQKTFSIDRRHSGNVSFEPSFGKSIHSTLTPNLISETIDYQIILDWSSIEIFLNDGVYSFTEQIFPKKPYTKLLIQSEENQKIRNFEISEIKRIW